MCLIEYIIDGNTLKVCLDGKSLENRFKNRPYSSACGDSYIQFAKAISYRKLSSQLPFSCIPQYPIIVLLLSLFPGSFFGCSGSRNRPFIRFYALSASKPLFSYLVRIILFPRASFVFKQGIYISKRIFTQIKNLMINIHRL